MLDCHAGRWHVIGFIAHCIFVSQLTTANSEHVFQIFGCSCCSRQFPFTSMYSLEILSPPPTCRIFLQVATVESLSLTEWNNMRVGSHEKTAKVKAEGVNFHFKRRAYEYNLWHHHRSEGQSWSCIQQTQEATKHWWDFTPAEPMTHLLIHNIFPVIPFSWETFQTQIRGFLSLTPQNESSGNNHPR